MNGCVALLFFYHSIANPLISLLFSLSHLHAHQGPRNRQVPTHLVEILLDLDAIGAIRHHDVPGLLPDCHRLPQYVLARRLRLRALHFVPLLSVCPILHGLLLAGGQEEQGEAGVMV